jgi:hypothetical protein
MKKLFFILIGIPFLSNAQIAVKVFGNFTPDGGNGAINYPFSNINYRPSDFFSIWSLAINKQLSKNRFIEIELGTFVFRQDNYNNLPVLIKDSIYTTSISTTTKSVGCRVEYGKTILGNAIPKNWSLSIAHSLKPTYVMYASKPLSNNSYPITTNRWMVKYTIVPHINYMFNKHLGIDVNFPIQLMQLGILSQHIENPNLAAGQQKWTTFDFDALNKSNFISLRCGVIYKI